MIPSSKSFQRSVVLIACFIFLATHPAISVDLNIEQASKPQEGNHEYLWYEAENMRGFTTGKLGQLILNPSYLELPKEKSPGWGMNGPGVSAEWTQGGESEWNSAAASANETNALDLSGPGNSSCSWAGGKRPSYSTSRIMQLGRGQSGQHIQLPESCSWEGGRAGITFNFHCEIQRRPR